MRTIGTIPHEKFHITVFEWSGKTIIKLEAGPMEQIYKFSSDQVVGIEGANKILNATFLKKIHARFNQMFLDMQESLKNS